jgi:diadenylate cyclase
MDQLIQQVGRLLARFDWTSVVDILILALLIYGLLSILQGTRAEILFRGVIIVLLVGFVVISIWPEQLPVLRWLIQNSVQVLLVAILVIFAPEMRRALEQIGHTGDFINRPLSHRTQDATLLMIDQVVAAAVYLSNQRWGGLIIIERTTGLQDIANKGVQVNGEVSSALLGNIFVPNTPLHDGAVIIRQNRVVAAACVLPLSENLGQNEHFGTRHKAAVGITEQSDAVAVVVSEETGNISIANNGRIYTKLSRESLREMLVSLLQPSALRSERRNGRRIVNRNLQRPVNGHKQTEEKGKPAALGKELEDLNESSPIIQTARPDGDETRRAIIEGKPAEGKTKSETVSLSTKSEEKVRSERREP